MPFYAVGSYCATHVNASQCQVTSTQYAVVGYLIVALIVVLAIFELVWKFRTGNTGPISRAVLRVAGSVSGGDRRSKGSGR